MISHQSSQPASQPARSLHDRYSGLVCSAAYVGVYVCMYVTVEERDMQVRSFIFLQLLCRADLDCFGFVSKSSISGGFDGVCTTTIVWSCSYSR